MWNIRFPNTFEDAELLLKNSLDSGILLLKTYNSPHSRLCHIEFFNITEPEENNNYANIDLTLSYNFQVIGVSTAVNKVRKLRLFHTGEDSIWTKQMIDKIWEGNFPTTIALDTDSGELFFFNIIQGRVELVEFSYLTDSELESVKFELNDRSPFTIKIAPEAMFSYIDGSEGTNHLKANINVVLNCGVPITLEHILRRYRKIEDEVASTTDDNDNE